MSTHNITETSTMQDVLAAYPGAQRALMRRYHIGGCSSCGFQPGERLGEVLKRHNVLAIGEVLQHLHDAHEQEAKLLVSPAEVAAELSGENPPRVIDVRTPDEQEICMIDGAVPATRELVQEMMNSWPKNTPIVVCCHRGMRSLDAASYLIGHGFTHVRSLAGGIEAWAAQVDQTMPTY